MRLGLVIAVILCCSFVMSAENGLRPGTIIPVSLDHGLNARKLHLDDRVRATVMQDIPGTPIHRRARVRGHVVKANADVSGKTELEIQFDSIRSRGKEFPFRASLRALASSMEVEQAQIPEGALSRGLPPEDWTTQQIGGEQVYRGGGPVTSGSVPVGTPAPWGILAVPRTQRGMPCRGAVGGVDEPQAFWLFSSDACGVYGFDQLQICHAGRSEPVGIIRLLTTKGKLNLGSGTGLLLRVD